VTDVPIGFSTDDVRKAIISDDRTTQDLFRAEFAPEIERAVRAVAAAHRALDHFRLNAQPSILAAGQIADNSPVVARSLSSSTLLTLLAIPPPRIPDESERVVAATAMPARSTR